MLLGYSSTDEALLRPHTNLGVQDAVRALQNYVLSEIDNQVRYYLTFQIYARLSRQGHLIYVYLGEELH